MITVSADPLCSAEILKEFECRMDHAGAVVCFSGQVRPKAINSDVIALHLQAYEPMTTNGIRSAADAALERWPLDGLVVHHRVGKIKTGETIVFVATASAHRRAAFEAADFLMDYLKTEAVFWKKEITDQGEVWIEPRAEDYKDRDRWTSNKASAE
ncbi:MAG: molybdenum cofactor biosynthesis protein MoaE [Ponticaulis sp.]|nr:molybdenum cofactor biosynthesis protein MoaE [Ponticaulis sp.]|tara:strand:+ start:13798 stop:14265 length:468 start_codon:yes stop_codon:yes gene_type:complete